jgi:hypothetical protein
MSNERPNAVFNIGSQHGNVSNVAGDMTVYGGQQYMAVPADMIRPELAKLRRALSALDLDPDIEAAALQLLTTTDHELGQRHPDPHKIARPLERMTMLLKNAGVLAAAGAELISPIQHIAAFLGTAGQAIMQLIL